MKLFLTQGWAGTERFIKDNPNESEISQILKSLNWKDFNIVRLQRDSRDWIDVSGNLGKDGLSIVLENNESVYVSNKAPESIIQLDEALKLYLNNDPILKEKWFSVDKPSKRLKDKISYESWREKYIEEQKTERKNLKYAILVATILVCFLSYFLYLLFTDELEFIGHDTTEVTAIVTKTEIIPAYRGLRQSVKYTFTYGEKSFIGYFIKAKSEIIYSEGDKVIIKIATDDPNISKKVARPKI